MAAKKAYVGPTMLKILWADGREDSLPFGQPAVTAVKVIGDRKVGGNLNSYAGGVIACPDGAPPDHKTKVSCNVTVVAPR